MEDRKANGSEWREGKDGRAGVGDEQEPRAPQGAAEPRQDDVQPMDDDEVELIGDLGGEFDDPEGWMSERADYWIDWTDPPLPSRAALLRHRIGEFIALLRSLMPHKAPAWPAERVAEAVWHRAVEEVFGPGSLPGIEAGASALGAVHAPPSADGASDGRAATTDVAGIVGNADIATNASSTITSADSTGTTSTTSSMNSTPRKIRHSPR